MSGEVTMKPILLFLGSLWIPLSELKQPSRVIQQSSNQGFPARAISSMAPVFSGSLESASDRRSIREFKAKTEENGAKMFVGTWLDPQETSLGCQIGRG